MLREALLADADVLLARMLALAAMSLALNIGLAARRTRWRTARC